MSQESRGSSLNLGVSSIALQTPNTNRNANENSKYLDDRNRNVAQPNNLINTSTRDANESSPVPIHNKRLFVPDSDSDTSRPGSKKSTKTADSLRISGEENKLLSLLQSKMRFNKNKASRSSTPTKPPQSIIQNKEKSQISSPNVPIYQSPREYNVANRSYTTPSNNNRNNSIESGNIIRSDPQVTGVTRNISRQASLNFQRTPSASNISQNQNRSNDRIHSFQESMKNLLSQNYNGQRSTQNVTRSIISTDNSHMLRKTQMANSQPTLQSSQQDPLIRHSNKSVPTRYQTPSTQRVPNNDPNIPVTAQLPNNNGLIDRRSSSMVQITHPQSPYVTSNGTTSKKSSSFIDKPSKNKEKPPVIDLLYLDDGEEDEVEKDKVEKETHMEQTKKMEESSKVIDKSRGEKFESPSDESDESDDEEIDDEELKGLGTEKNLERESKEESASESDDESDQASNNKRTSTSKNTVDSSTNKMDSTHNNTRGYFYGDLKPSPEKVVSIVRSLGNKEPESKIEKEKENNVSKDLSNKTPFHDGSGTDSAKAVANTISKNESKLVYDIQKMNIHSLVSHSELTPEDKKETGVNRSSNNVSNPPQETNNNIQGEIQRNIESKEKMKEIQEHLLISQVSGDGNKISTTSVQESQINKDAIHDKDNSTNLNTHELPVVQINELKRQFAKIHRNMPNVNGSLSKMPRLTDETRNISKKAESSARQSKDSEIEKTNDISQPISQEAMFTSTQKSLSEADGTSHVQTEVPAQAKTGHPDLGATADSNSKTTNVSSRGSTDIVKLEDFNLLKDGVIQNYYRPLKNRLRSTSGTNKNGPRQPATLEVIYISDSDSEEEGGKSAQQSGSEASSKSDESDIEGKNDSEQSEEKYESDEKEEIGPKKIEEYDFSMNINYDDDDSSDMNENERVKLIKKYDKVLECNLMKYLKPHQSVQKRGLIRLMEGGIINHTRLSLNDSVSSTNDVCNVDNFESSPALFYQHLHKRSRLEEEKLSYELTDNFFRCGANLVSGKLTGKEKEITKADVLNEKIQGSNEATNQQNTYFQQKDKSDVVNTTNMNDTSTCIEKDIRNDEGFTKELTNLNDQLLPKEAVVSKGLSSPKKIQNLKEATVTDESFIPSKNGMKTHTEVTNEQNITHQANTGMKLNIAEDRNDANTKEDRQNLSIEKKTTHIPNSTDMINPDDKTIEKGIWLASRQPTETNTSHVNSSTGNVKSIHKISPAKDETSSTVTQTEVTLRGTEDKGANKKLNSREKWRKAWIANLKNCPFYLFEAYPNKPFTPEDRKKLDASFEEIKNTLKEKYSAPIMSDFNPETYIILLKGDVSDFKNNEEFKKIKAIAERPVHGRDMRIWSFDKISHFLSHMQNIPMPVLDKKNQDEKTEQRKESNNKTPETKEGTDHTLHAESINHRIDAREIPNGNEKEKPNEDIEKTKETVEGISRNVPIDNILETRAVPEDALRKIHHDNDLTSTQQPVNNVKDKSIRIIPDIKGTFEDNINGEVEINNSEIYEPSKLKSPQHFVGAVSETEEISNDDIAVQNSQHSEKGVATSNPESAVDHKEKEPNVHLKRADSHIKSMSTRLGNTVVQQHSFIPPQENEKEEKSPNNTSIILSVPPNPDDSNIVVSLINSQLTNEKDHNIYKEQENGRIITEMMSNLEDLAAELSAELKREQEENERARACILDLSNKLLEQEIANSRLKSSLEIERAMKQYVEEKNSQLGDALKRLKDQQKFGMYVNSMRLNEDEGTDK
ncbi:hypothetical protein C6P45_004269 [Maudiozyma exigua]|uniref:Sir4 SID domain-containing protein n=1 Tax=Maudiozyma exigua TaxID=34358 RepID=A0A9P7B9Y9_MAUEX|nr:hypothetical protein C6P45_004269 [Kazachstania exigua]